MYAIDFLAKYLLVVQVFHDLRKVNVFKLENASLVILVVDQEGV